MLVTNTYTEKDSSGIQLNSLKSMSWVLKYENVPKAANESEAPEADIINKILRPIRSTNIDDV